MIEPVEQYCRLGIVHFMAFPEVMGDESRLISTVEQIAKLPDFRCIELKLVENEHLLEPLKALLETSMLDSSIAAQPAILSAKLDPGSVDSAERKQTLSLLIRHVDQAIELGAESVAMLSGPDPGASKRSVGLEHTADLIAELCAYSQSHGGPKIILEVCDHEIDKKTLVGPAETAAHLCELVFARGAGNFGLCVDLSHLPLLGETPDQAIGPVQDYLATAHLGNAVLEKGHPLYGDQHPGFGTRAGANRVDQTRDFINALRNVGFLNRKHPPMLSFEVRPTPGETSEIVIAAALRVFRRAWAKA
jgi:sugar phosphate isomerase/epimerase